MRRIDWETDLEFRIGRSTFGLVHGMPEYEFIDRVPILKTHGMIEFYMQRCAGFHAKSALEFGIYEGGSLIFWAELFDLQTMVGVDIDEPKPRFASYCDKAGWNEKVSTYFRTSQSDEAAIGAIVDKHFSDTPLDLVIDDASHEYEFTRRSFELAFPRLRPGGFYVIEDWGWTHWGGVFQSADVHWRGKTSLSNLAFELAMACASTPNLIDHVEIYGHSIIVVKDGQAPVDRQPLILDEMIHMQGRAFSRL